MPSQSIKGAGSHPENSGYMAQNSSPVPTINSRPSVNEPTKRSYLRTTPLAPPGTVPMRRDRGTEFRNIQEIRQQQMKCNEVLISTQSVAVDCSTSVERQLEGQRRMQQMQNQQK